MNFLTPAAREGVEPQDVVVRFVLASESLPKGELYSMSAPRGPPEVTLALNTTVFRADKSSLKRHLSTVILQALSTLPQAPFGQGNPAAYQAAQRASYEGQNRPPTWLEKNVPLLKNVSLFSRSMESIFNRALAEKLQEKFGFDMLRFLSQTNKTVGLGHWTYAYH